MKTRELKIVVLGVAISLFTSAKMNAQKNGSDNRQGQEPPSIEEIFEQMDKNEDGQLSEKEVKGPLKNDFSEIDTDEDGFLSVAEVEEAPKPKGRPQR